MNEELKAVLIEIEDYLRDEYDKVKENLVIYQDFDNDQINRLRGGAMALRRTADYISNQRKRYELEFMKGDDE